MNEEDKGVAHDQCMKVVVPLYSHCEAHGGKHKRKLFAHGKQKTKSKSIQHHEVEEGHL